MPSTIDVHISYTILCQLYNTFAIESVLALGKGNLGVGWSLGTQKLY